MARHLKTALLVEAIGVPVVLLSLTPHWPKTVLGWALVVLLGPPLWLLGEFLFEWVGEIIPDDSVATAVYGFILLLLLLGGYILYRLFLADHVRPHFY